VHVLGELVADQDIKPQLDLLAVMDQSLDRCIDCLFGGMLVRIMEILGIISNRGQFFHDFIHEKHQIRFTLRFLKRVLEYHIFYHHWRSQFLRERSNEGFIGKRGFLAIVTRARRARVNARHLGGDRPVFGSEDLTAPPSVGVDSGFSKPLTFRSLISALSFFGKRSGTSCAVAGDRARSPRTA